MSSIANMALRGFEVRPSPRVPRTLLRTKKKLITPSQLFCSVIVLALSANLVATQRFGGAPSVTNYEVFVGILGIVAALIGLAGSFISSLGGVIALAVDALTALFLFAGGIVRILFALPLSSSCRS